VPRDRLWGRAALPLGGGAIAVGKGLRAKSGLEGVLVGPAGDHQPLLPVVGGVSGWRPGRVQFQLILGIGPTWGMTPCWMPF
jgi:hypothetical protein